MYTTISRYGWKTRVFRSMMAFMLVFLLVGCTVTTDRPPSRAPEPRPTASEATPTARQLTRQEAERLQRTMIPLLQHMNDPLSPRQVRVGVLADRQINAANAGGGEFYVTTGLLDRAGDRELQGVMAHEIAHADLNHVSKLQTRAAGVGLGVLLGSFALDQLFPGTGEVASQLGQVAGQYYLASYSRQEELAADAHAVEILRRAGYDGKATMIGTLSWLRRTAGEGGGGFFATHPETGDRIQELRSMR
jgi:predicted Zn-dependent protease